MAIRLRKLRNDMRLQGKRVLVRIDGNVPIKNGKAIDGPHGRIARVAVDLDWLLQRGARVVILTHLGRPDGKRKAAYSVKPVAKRLSSLLGLKVEVFHALFGSRTEQLVGHLKDGQMLMLENMRFDAREMQDDSTFAKALARMGDLYVNDAFADSHRAHTSVSALAYELPSYAGPLLVNEIAVMSQLEQRAKKPFVLLMGGVKAETKLPVIEHLAKQSDRVLLGGALATTFLAAKGFSVGRSVYEENEIAIVRAIPEALREKIVIPKDVLVASSFRKDASVRTVPVDRIGARDRIVDLGPQTLETYTGFLSQAKTIVWNGPLGFCEIDRFCHGTETLARVIAKRTGQATTIVGGGDTGPVIERLNLADQFTLLSTGGGAMLAFLAGQKMPGLEPLII